MREQKDYQRNVILASLKNLKEAVREKMLFENFIAASVESIMILEREEYLRELQKRIGKEIKGTNFIEDCLNHSRQIICRYKYHGHAVGVYNRTHYNW